MRASQKILSLALVLSLCGFGTPAFAAESNGTAAAGTSYSNDAPPKVGSGEDALTVQELLEAGSYVEGRVLARVTDDFEMPSPRGRNAQPLAIEGLYEYDASSSDMTAENDAVEYGASALSPFSNTFDEPATPDRVVVIESSTQTTEALLISLIGVDSVVMAEPDYLRVLDNPTDLDDETTAVDAGAADSGNGFAATAADPFVPNDPLFPAQSHLQRSDTAIGGTNVQDLWEALWPDGLPASASSPEDDQRIVAILDTGVDYSNPDLENVMWTGGESVDENSGPYGYDFADNDADPMDAYGHGTHVAGIVAAESGNGEGVSGMAPNARIMALRVGGDNGAILNSNAARAYQYLKKAAKTGLNIVAANNSWGGIGVDALLSSIMEDLYKSYGVISVCAAGNEAKDNDLVTDQPGNARGTIVVNAVDRTGGLTSFSNYGAVSTDLAAPGYSILSTVMLQDAAALLVDENKVAVRDTFDETSGSEEPLAFTFFEVSQAKDEGCPQVTLEAAAESDAEGKVDGHGLAWTVTNPADQMKAALDFTATDEAKLSIDRDDPPSVVAFDAVSSDLDGGFQRLLRVYMKGADNGWIEISDPDQPPYVVNNEWSTFSFALDETALAQIDWSNPVIRIERTFTRDAGVDVTFSIDNVALAHEGAYAVSPYREWSGTSMAAPVVSGALALLATTYPQDSATTRRARLLGSVARSKNLEGTCTSDGRLDLSRTSNPLPVVDAVEQDGNDSAQLSIKGAFFGSETGAVLIEGVDAAELAITFWSDAEVRVALPSGLADDMRYVTVQRADGNNQTGRQLAFVKGTADDASAVFFDTLPAPDLAELGINAAATDTPWHLATAQGKVYATSSYVYTTRTHASEAAAETLLLVYDPHTQAWSVDERFRGIESDGVLMSASDDMLYLYAASIAKLYRYDPGSGDLDLVADCADKIDPGTAYAQMLVENGTAWIVGGLLIDEQGNVVGAATVTKIDLATGSVETCLHFNEARLFPAAQFVEGALVVAAGGEAMDAVTTTCERLSESTFSPAAAMPEGILARQLATSACATLPSGSTVVAIDGTSVTLAGESLIVSGLACENEAGKADTFVYDPVADTWITLQKRLAPVKIPYAGGTVLNGDFYVLGLDPTDSVSHGKGLVFSRLTIKDQDTPDDPSGSNLPTSADHQGSTPTVLASTGDYTGFEGVAAVFALATLVVAMAAARKRSLQERQPEER